MPRPRKDVQKVAGKVVPNQEPRKLRRYQVFRDIMQKRLMGYSVDELRDILIEKYDYAQPTADNLIAQSAAIMDIRLSAYSEASADKNLRILNTLLDKSLDEDDTQSAVKIMDVINKMTGAYTENVNIHSDTPIFQINVGNQ